MEVYTTENEQVSALKNFFVENGKAIAAGLITVSYTHLTLPTNREV